LHLTPLADADPLAIETLLDTAFGTDRRTRTAYRLREGTAWLPGLSFAAWKGERLVGSLQSWPVALRSAGGYDQLVMVGPVAVAPDVQGTGIGRALMDTLVAAAAHESADALMMIGDPEYYCRWGFSAEASAGWRIDGPYEQHRLLARLNRPAASAGMLVSLRQARDIGEPAALASA